jgi:hypothetical protein
LFAGISLGFSHPHGFGRFEISWSATDFVPLLLISFHY